MALQEDSAEGGSVYQDITRLCEKFAVDLYADSLTKQKVVKNLRSRAFSKLLFFKHVLENDGDIESNIGFLLPDIYLKIHILRKKNLYDSTKEKKENVFKMLDRVQKVAEQDTGIASALQLLLLLADTKISDKNNEVPMFGLDLRKYSDGNLWQNVKNPYSVLPDSEFECQYFLYNDLYPFTPQYKHSRSCHFMYPCDEKPGTGLSTYFSCPSLGVEKRFSPFYKDLNDEEFDSIKWRFPSTSLEQRQINTSIHADEGYVTPDKDHLWEIETSEKSVDYWDGSHLKPSSSFLTWKDLGSKDSKREQEFLSQSKTSIFHLWRIVRANSISKETGIPSTHLIEVTMESLSHDIKNLLIAIESNTFYYRKESRSFVMNEGVYIAGVTPDILQEYCQDYINCANSYHLLTDLINQDFNSENKLREGRIFKTLCRCVQRYIQCYRGIILRLPLSQGLLKINHWVVTLRTQLDFLAKLCCIYPSEETETLPHGGALLVYIYDKVTEVVRKDLAYILYYILETCCHVYFRVLEKWIFEGVCDDPYGEFFIVAKPEADISYDRLFWTRGFVLNRLLVPGFLKGLENDLFICGKSVSLLKLSNLNDPLLRCLQKKHPGVNCCLDQEGLDLVLSECLEFKELCINECGSRPRVFCTLTEEEEEAYRISLTKQREKTCDIIRKAQDDNKRIKTARKQEVFEELKKGMEDEKARKIEARQSQLLEEVKMLETAVALEQVENQRREQIRKNLVEYFKSLSVTTEKQILMANWKLKRMQLSKVRLEFFKTEQEKFKNELSTLIDFSKDEAFNENNIIYNAAYSAGTGGFNIPNNIIQSHNKSLVILESASGGFSTDNNTKNNNGNYGTMDVLQNENGSSQAQLNKVKVLQEEFDIPQGKKTEDNEKPDFPVYKSDVGVEKRSEKEDRIKKELKSLEAVMVHADEARQKAIENREKTYGRDYNIVTGECRRNTELECNIVDVTEETTSVNINTQIGDAIVSSADIIDDIATVNNNESSALELVPNESSDQMSHVSTLDIVEKPETAGQSTSVNLNTQMDESIVPSKHIIDNIVIDNNNKPSVLESILNESSSQISNIAIQETVLKPETEIKIVESYYRDIVNGVDKCPIVIDIIDNIPCDVEKKREINVEHVDITQIYNCLQKSVLFPLQIQLGLVNDAILRLFINEHNLVAHLDCIRKYFFLLDGDYGCNLTKNLFSEMQSVRRPSLLLNHIRLNSLLRTAVGNNSEEDLAERLSFRVNKVPTSFHLTDPKALACLSMTYKTHWPLNVIITPQAIAKYDRVFTFLMQLRRASWALEQDIYLLKKVFPTTSPQYRQVQLFRHIMAQFLQALQNYVMTTVMEYSWLELKKALDKATTLEALYVTHVNYVKKVIFRCLLNKRSKVIHKHLLDLFRIILTFHENLRSDDWTEGSNGEFQHPAFPRLCHQYGQFLELSRFMFSYLERLVTSGYQPHLEQLLTLLSCNNFYKTRDA